MSYIVSKMGDQGFKMSESARKPFSEYRKRLWAKGRKPWDGEQDAVDALRNAMWKSVFDLSDKTRTGYTVAELSAACKIILKESSNHGAYELGHGNPYDVDRIEAKTDQLCHDWMTKKAESISIE